MVNILLVSHDYKHTAKCLDDETLLKQIEDCVLLVDIIIKKVIFKKVVKEYEALNIFKDKHGLYYPLQFCKYIDAMVEEYIKRTGKLHSWLNERSYYNKMFVMYNHLFGSVACCLLWTEVFYTNVKANLIRRKPKYYKKVFGLKIKPVKGYLFETCCAL